jgi:Zinc-binding dehydrogenase
METTVGNLDWVLRFEEIVEAHSYMEENKAKGKLVVKVHR